MPKWTGVKGFPGLPWVGYLSRYRPVIWPNWLNSFVLYNRQYTHVLGSTKCLVLVQTKVFSSVVIFQLKTESSLPPWIFIEWTNCSFKLTSEWIWIKTTKWIWHQVPSVLKACEICSFFDILLIWVKVSVKQYFFNWGLKQTLPTNIPSFIIDSEWSGKLL